MLQRHLVNENDHENILFLLNPTRKQTNSLAYLNVLTTVMAVINYFTMMSVITVIC